MYLCVKSDYAVTQRKNMGWNANPPEKIITWSLSAVFCGSVWVISYAEILYHEHCATLG